MSPGTKFTSAKSSTLLLSLFCTAMIAALYVSLKSTSSKLLPTSLDCSVTTHRMTESPRRFAAPTPTSFSSSELRTACISSAFGATSPSSINAHLQIEIDRLRITDASVWCSESPIECNPREISKSNPGLSVALIPTITMSSKSCVSITTTILAGPANLDSRGAESSSSGNGSDGSYPLIMSVSLFIACNFSDSTLKKGRTDFVSIVKGGVSMSSASNSSICNVLANVTFLPCCKSP
mmetsp:Transcript_25068/g.45151  ORF Transcript_25068/g.45151 Transcript_25068/m.45151 type:complete len:237 (+) Transcript_25068:1906-2616(+)